MMIVSNLLSTFGLTRRELHGREMGIPFIWMWCHWAVMTNNPLFKFKRNISQLIFGILADILYMCDNDEAINNQKQWGKGHILLTRATLGELVLHLGKSLSGGVRCISWYHAQWTLVNGHVRIYQGLLFYYRSKNWNKKVWNIFTSSHSAPSRERPCTATSPFSTCTNKKY